jgi:hypothetical protein
VSTSDGLTFVGLIVVLGVAIVGWRHALRVARDAARRADRADQRAAEANTHAAEANDLAASGVELAKSADARAERLESRETEHRDVRWVLTWNRETSNLTATNVGTTDAHDVELAVDTIGQNIPRQREESELIQPTESLAIDLSWSVADPRQRNAQNRGSNVIITRAAHLRVQLVWRSEVGKPDVYVEDDFRVI